MEGFWQTLSDIFVKSRQYREMAMTQRQRYLLPTLLLSTIPIWLVLILPIRMKIKEKREAYLKARGTYLKEKPIKEMRICLSESVRIAYKVEKAKTKDAEEYAKAAEENKALKKEIFGEIVSIIPREEICLIGRSGSVYAKRKDGEIKEEEERNRSFRLDVSTSWEKKRNDEWLKKQETVTNKAGQVIGIRGIDEETARLGYDIFIPKAKEEELKELSLTELLRYCEAENCKLQIREQGSVYIFSDVEGYTKEDVIGAIRKAAEERGIKVKVK